MAYDDLGDGDGLAEAAEEEVDDAGEDEDDADLIDEEREGEVQRVVADPDAGGGDPDGWVAEHGVRCPVECFR